MTFVKGQFFIVSQQFQRDSLKPLGQFQLNFICSLQKVYTFGPGHMTKLAMMPKYVISRTT